jgi:penicillin-insensitive murein endopeptidase
MFGRARAAAALEPAPIGFYSRGCLAGAQQLPIDGPNWQVMRLSRNRNWGHPELVEFLKRFAAAATKNSNWPGILVGDMAQPRGGPMLTGHVSHQIGLDADIWLIPMPARVLSRSEREEMSSVEMVRRDRLDIDSQGVDRKPSRRAAHGGDGPGRATHIREPRDQARPVPRSGGTAVAGQDPAGKGPRLALPRAHVLPAMARRAPSRNPRRRATVATRRSSGGSPTRGLNPKETPPRPPLVMADLPAQCREVLSAQQR